MPKFHFHPTQPQRSVAAVEPVDGSEVFALADRMQCTAADLYQDGLYAFSIRLADEGVWRIERRPSYDAEALCEADQSGFGIF